jgi:chemotaxis protein methyltransferase CheR
MSAPLTRHAGVPKLAPLDDYAPFCEAVRAICGVDLLQYKRGQMERRIRTWTARRGSGDLGEYARRLRSDAGELDAFLDRVTINVSQLWRHPEQWTTLATEILPELAEANRGRVRAWSAGCSYGAEAYTLAAVAASTVPGARVSITGTDIDGRMVQRARDGRFSAADARTTPPGVMERWFTQLPDGTYEVKPQLKTMARFEVGDLLRMQPRPGSFDLVMCRNTVIYFNDEVRDALHARLATALRPGGYLIVGATERVTDPAGIGLAPTHPFTYRKN